MKIVYKEEALNDLIELQCFISKIDSPARAKQFTEDIRLHIKSLLDKPNLKSKVCALSDFKYSESIFKGHFIIHNIEETRVVILTII